MHTHHTGGLRGLAFIALLPALLLAQVGHAAPMLGVTFETFTGGGGGTLTDDRDVLSRDLPTGFGSASLHQLRAFNESDSFSNTSYHNRASWNLSDVVFSADVPGTDIATFRLGGDLTAVLSGSTPPGNFRGAGAGLGVDWSLFYFRSDGSTVGQRGSLFQTTASVGGLDAVRDFAIDVDEYVSVLLTVPVDIPISLGVTLGATASYRTIQFGDGGRAVANAANTLAFDPDRFFDILTPGVTASSVSGGLVNNQLPQFQSVAVPAPSTPLLAAIGWLAMLVLRAPQWRRQSR